MDETVQDGGIRLDAILRDEGHTCSYYANAVQPVSYYAENFQIFQLVLGGVTVHTEYWYLGIFYSSSALETR